MRFIHSCFSWKLFTVHDEQLLSQKRKNIISLGSLSRDAIVSTAILFYERLFRTGNLVAMEA